MATLPEGASLPPNVKLEDLTRDPGGRYGHYYHEKSDTVYNLGFALDIDASAATGAPVKSPKDLTGTKVKFVGSGARGVISEMGDPEAGDEFYVRVQVDGTEVAVKNPDDIKRLTPNEIKAWDKELAEASK